MSDLFIYQSFHNEEGEKSLDTGFIPYNNLANEAPHLREYPMLKKLFFKHRDSDAHWGLVSWRWKQKTHLNPTDFIEWIKDNPGYDVYHIDPALSDILYPNLWVQGDIWHPGILDFGNKLLPKMGIDVKLEELLYKSDDFSTSNFCIGNDKFWKEWFLFLDYALTLSSQDDELYSFLYKQGQIHTGDWIPFFSFVVERLYSIFFMFNRNVTMKKFPIDHMCYNERYGPLHSVLIRIYNERNI